MTKERLEEIEEAFVDLILVGEDGAVLNGAIMELVAEVRCCWTEIEELSSPDEQRESRED